MSQRSLSEFASAVRRLESAARRLDADAGWLRLQPLDQREWFRVLIDKLIPQLSDDSFIVVAVVGGTNTGKSVVFNHLAGVATSAATPLASGTKHPVCLVPEGFFEENRLQEIFTDFQLRPWEAAQEAQQEACEHLLFWKESRQLPENLLILDTPDIDSDAPVNWTRADMIRRSSDVLVAILTQQKYNDAAVKTFFRSAAEDDKTIVVVFNQVWLDGDEEYWPLWLKTFCDETGVDPAMVYLAPHDRRAAEELSLPFHERRWPPPASDSAAADAVVEKNGDLMGRSLREDLSRLRFDQIKIRSLDGALRHVTDPRKGTRGWLTELDAGSQGIRGLADELSANKIVRVHGWPSVPFSLVFDEFWSWWKAHRTGWTKGVSSFYEVVNRGVAWPFQQARQMLGGGETLDPVERYRAHEFDAIVRATEEVFHRLTLIAQSHNGPARDEFERLTRGESREQFLKTIQAQHNDLDLRDELHRLIARDMHSFFDENPRAANWLRRIDVVAVGSRPALSMLLFAVGAHGVDVAAQGLVNVGIDFLAGSAASAGGDTIFSKAAGGLGAHLFARLHALSDKFAEARGAWLAEQMRTHLLGALPKELQRIANLSDSASYREVEQALHALETLVERPTPPSLKAIDHAS